MEERSAGAIVYHENNLRKYLLLKQSSGQWGFPKGNIEAGEDEIETAEREVKEETGLEELKFIKGFRKEISYFYKRDGKTIYKKVVYFLAKASSDKVKISYEHEDYSWFTFDLAIKHLSHANSRALLSQAENFLSSKIGKTKAVQEDAFQQA